MPGPSKIEKLKSKPFSIEISWEPNKNIEGVHSYIVRWINAKTLKEEAVVSTKKGITQAYSGEKLFSGTLYRVEVQGIRNFSRFEKNTETKFEFFRTSYFFICYVIQLRN